ncbi:LamG domain-containing protein, partial [Sulfuricurvum sp.]|uniref:LamG domain-containing protein n=1 Tax=Sulfuricurvum sp. TaxID=2025608 RepID=UPI0035670A94
MSLVAHYKLNDNAANTAVVASVGTNGTLVGGNTTAQLHVAGKISGALNFDGTSDYVNIGLQSFNAAAGSICAWFKADDYTPATDRNIVARNAAGNVAGDFLIRLRASDSKLIGQIQDGVSSFNAYSNSALADTNWHWLLFTWSAVETALYLDNVKQSVPALGTTLAAHPTVGMAIGSGYNAGASLCWDGLIDDVRIYTHVLTALERAFIYNSGAGTEAVYVPPSFSVSESIVVNEISTFRSSRIRGDFADGAILSDSASFLIKPP